MNANGYDIIGDIHGHAEELKALLEKLGYRLQGDNIYYHPERKVIFLGDFIDRGKQNREVLRVAKGMVESGTALAIMGNHEYNAICFHTYQEINGQLQPLREHSGKNIHQHQEPLREFNNGKDSEWIGYISWFKSLPLFLEIEGIRLVHACWSKPDITFVKEQLPEAKLTEEFLNDSAKKGTRAYQAIEHLLKGTELKLPDGIYFYDADKVKREEIRTKWWEKPSGKTFKDYTVGKKENIPETLIPDDITVELEKSFYYDVEEPPVFFGHYWFQGLPERLENNIACLDYSVAKDKGRLAAYRWSGESALDNSNFVFVEKI